MGDNNQNLVTVLNILYNHRNAVIRTQKQISNNMFVTTACILGLCYCVVTLDKKIKKLENQIAAEQVVDLLKNISHTETKKEVNPVNNYPFTVLGPEVKLEKE